MSGTAVLGGRNPGFGSGDLTQILEALQRIAGEGGTLATVITLTADPGVTATAADFATFGKFDGRLFIHCTDAADTNWLDLTWLESLKEEIETICNDDGAALHTLAGIQEALSALKTFSGTVERGVDPATGWSASGGAGNVLPVFATKNVTRWSRAGGRVQVDYEGRAVGGTASAGTGQLIMQLPRPASDDALTLIRVVGSADVYTTHLDLWGRIDPTDSNIYLYKVVDGVRSNLTGADLSSEGVPLQLFLSFSYEAAVLDA